MTTTQTTKCSHPKCNAEFFIVAARQFPNLCIDHAADASRANGWTPENSAD